MNFHVLTLFPELIEQVAQSSMIGRAIRNGIVSVQAIDIRDFANNKHKKVDDYTYGGGAGMLMQAQPVFDACFSVLDRIPKGRQRRVIYVTPQGTPFSQKMAGQFAKSDELIILCGHYEGIDERVLEEVVTDYVSIGDYVLTGGELPAMVMVDAIARLIPGVLNNDESAETESFGGYLLEYPQYSRPEVWKGKVVPKVLLSGNRKEIRKWRLEQAIERTRERRPDLYLKYQELEQYKKELQTDKLSHMEIIDCINCGVAELVRKEDTFQIIRNKQSEVNQIVGYTDSLPLSEQQLVIVHDNRMAKKLDMHREGFWAVYTLKEKKALTYQRKLKAQGVLLGVNHDNPSEILAFQEQSILAKLKLSEHNFITKQDLFLLHEKEGLIEAMLVEWINLILEKGKTPIVFVEKEDVEWKELCIRVGFCVSKNTVWIWDKQI